MEELLKKFENKAPEIVFEWNDSETEAHGWVVINSLRGGAAGGGTRMRKGLDKNEVRSLAKTMEIKFSVCGPQIGGAKSGINFDPSDPRKDGVLRRWYQSVMPLLKSYYGTGGDMNVDEVHEVIPITEDFGLWHPQEGIVNGHFKSRENQKIAQIGQLRLGVSKVLEDERYTPSASKKYMVADMITGYGVAEAVVHYYDNFKKKCAGKKVLIQGWGNVASAAGYYLAKEGASIIGIIDKDGGLYKPEGFTFSEVEQLFLTKRGNKLNHPDMIPFEEINETIWDCGCEVFVPCAASRLVSQKQAERLISAGVEVISCGANVPFADKEIFWGPIARYVDKNCGLIPDFIANCGMARVFAYLMQPNAEISDQALFDDVSHTIYNALKDVFYFNHGSKNITRTAFEGALNKLIT